MTELKTLQDLENEGIISGISKTDANLIRALAVEWVKDLQKSIDKCDVGNQRCQGCIVKNSNIYLLRSFFNLTESDLEEKE